VRKIEAPYKKGASQIAWDMRHASDSAIRPGQRESNNPWRRRFNAGHIAAPGAYTVTLTKVQNGTVTELAEPQSFNVVPLRDGTLEGKTPKEYQRFAETLGAARQQLSAVNNRVSENMKIIDALGKALERSNAEPGAINEKLYAVKKDLTEIDISLNGNPVKNEVGERNNPTIGNRLGVARRGLFTTYGPTEMHLQCLKIALKTLDEIVPQVKKIDEVTIPELEQELQKAGAPYIQGQSIPDKIGRP